MYQVDLYGSYCELYMTSITRSDCHDLSVYQMSDKRFLTILTCYYLFRLSKDIGPNQANSISSCEDVVAFALLSQFGS